jgi:murein DD-endopeptidase
MPGRFACALLACAIACSLPQVCTAQGAAVLRESFDLQIPVAPTPVGVGGQARLHYEVHLSNFTAGPLRPEALQIADAASGRILAAFAGSTLSTRLAPVGPADAAHPEGSVAAGRRAVLHVELDLPATAVPRALSHRVVYTAPSDATRHAVAGPTLAVALAPLPLLGAPVRGGPWVVIHDASWPRGHRRVFYSVDGQARLPGRFATDWVRVDDQGRTTRGDAALARNALGYGAEVVAVADATVVAVRNDYPEHARVADNRKHPLSGASGNHVVLDLGAGRYAFYEHLRPGSVRVSAGQRVRRGEVLGALGFSGDSTGPHLHFHVADGPTPLGAEGRPFALDQFRVLGRYTDLSALGKAAWTPHPGTRPAQRRHEWPEGNSVIVLE